MLHLNLNISGGDMVQALIGPFNQVVKLRKYGFIGKSSVMYIQTRQKIKLHYK